MDTLFALTHWGRDKIDAISQTTFWSTFSWMKMFEFRLKFHWNLFLRVQLTIFQHWFRYWLGAVQATSHYLNQWWLDYRRIYAPLGLNELTDTLWVIWMFPLHLAGASVDHQKSSYPWSDTPYNSCDVTVMIHKMYGKTQRQCENNTSKRLTTGDEQLEERFFNTVISRCNTST